LSIRAYDGCSSFAKLGLDPLDLVLVVLRLEDFDRGNGDFPVAALAHARRNPHLS
jgi:hypothetical protein